MPTHPHITQSILTLLRPKQWAKGVFVLIGPLYALTDPKNHWQTMLPPALMAMVALCLLSSAGYIVNDILDAPRDRLHPRKSRRPIASGAISPKVGWMVAAVVGGLGAAAALAVARVFPLESQAQVWVGPIALAYVVNTNLYSLFLKRIVIADVIGLSLGFVLRVLAGCAAAGVQPSTWLLNCTLFLAMFLSFGKRLGERRTIGVDASAVRGVQQAYTDELLRSAVGVTCVVTLVTYASYIQARDAIWVGRVGADLAPGWWINPLWLSMLPATYGMLRCVVLLERGRYDDPTEIVARDWPTQVAGLAFGVVTAAAVILGKGGGG
jgi:decaprenyl-phosphate phosphoribosyltransferase